jgi:hypothetical protein
MKKKDPNKRVWGIPPKRVQETPNIVDVLNPVENKPEPVKVPEPTPIPKPVDQPIKKEKKKAAAKEEPLLDSDIVKPKKHKKEKETPYQIECMGCHKIYWYHERPRNEEGVSICMFPRCKSTSYMMID